jgi:hypothetical protein
MGTPVVKIHAGCVADGDTSYLGQRLRTWVFAMCWHIHDITAEEGSTSSTGIACAAFEFAETQKRDHSLRRAFERASRPCS